jgi:hypothetical protein
MEEDKLKTLTPQEEKILLEEENKTLRDAFQKELDIELSDLPASLRGLLARLPVQEQIDFLKQHKEEQSKHPSKKQEPKLKTWDEIRGKKKEVQHYPIDWRL